MRCQRAWAYRYVDKLREPEIDWNDPRAPWLNAAKLPERQRKAAYRARSKALGKATHGVFEAWQEGRAVNWRDLPGQVALSGAHHIPHPERVHTARVEAPIGNVPLPPGKHEDAPAVAYSLHGVLWVGYRDLLVSAPGEFIRLKIGAPDGWALYDYKSSASIDEYALSGAELERDPQANLYAAATCDELGLTELPARWLYLETKKVRRSLPVDAVIQRDAAKNTMVQYALKARELDQIERTTDAPMNVGACGEYGGCYYHVSNGGPCNAQRSVGALIQARVRKKEPMPLDPTAKSKFDAFKNGGAAASSASNPPAEDPAPAAPSAPAKTRARKPSATGNVNASGPAGSVLALSAELVDAQQAADAANARVTEILGQIKQACG